MEEDESGNVHEHERKVTESGDGKVTIVETDTFKDEQGNVIKGETDVIEIEEDEQGNIHRR